MKRRKINRIKQLKHRIIVLDLINGLLPMLGIPLACQFFWTNNWGFITLILMLALVNLFTEAVLSFSKQELRQCKQAYRRRIARTK